MFLHFFLIRSNFNNLTTNPTFSLKFVEVEGRYWYPVPERNNDVKAVFQRWCFVMSVSCGKVGKVWFWQRSNNYSNAVWDYKSSLSNRDSIDSRYIMTSHDLTQQSGSRESTRDLSSWWTLMIHPGMYIIFYVSTPDPPPVVWNPQTSWRSVSTGISQPCKVTYLKSVAEIFQAKFLQQSQQRGGWCLGWTHRRVVWESNG